MLVWCEVKKKKSMFNAIKFFYTFEIQYLQFQKENRNVWNCGILQMIISTRFIPQELQTYL